MKRFVVLAVLAALGVTAGCIGSQEAGSTNTEPANATDALTDRDVGELDVLATQELSARSNPSPTWEGGAFEPIVDVAPEGTVYVTARAVDPPGDLRQSLLWVSQDEGASFQRIPWADAETGVSNLPVGFEGDLGVDAGGSVYFVDTTNAGTTVSRSADGGDTWELRSANAFLVPGGDRPWVQAGPEGLVVVAWDDALSFGGLTRPVVAVSTDGGLTFPVQTGIVPCASFPGVADPGLDGYYADYQNGDLALAPDGTIYLSVNCESHGVEVHRSTDGGATFEAFTVHERAGIPPDFVPVATDEAGNVYVTWPQHGENSSQIYYAASTDEGETWGDPVRVSVHGGASLLPWIEAREDGRLAVAYYGAPSHAGLPWKVGEDASWFPFATEVRHATADAPELFHTRMTDAAVADGPECGTNNTGCPGGVAGNLRDYMGADLGPDGRVHVAWTMDHEEGPHQVAWGVAAEAGQEGAP